MSIAARIRMGRSRGLVPDRPRGLPTAGRFAFGERFSLKDLFRVRRPPEDFDVPDPKFSRAFWKFRKGWRGRLVAGE